MGESFSYMKKIRMQIEGKMTSNPCIRALHFFEVRLDWMGAAGLGWALRRVYCFDIEGDKLCWPMALVNFCAWQPRLRQTSALNLGRGLVDGLLKKMAEEIMTGTENASPSTRMRKAAPSSPLGRWRGGTGRGTIVYAPSPGETRTDARRSRTCSGATAGSMPHRHAS